MTRGLVVEQEDLAIVRDILGRHLGADTQVWTYGSRATGKRVWRGSDLDLMIKSDAPLSLTTRASMADDFSESLLPFMVDLHDWHATSEDFLSRIAPNFIAVLSDAHKPQPERRAA